MNGRWEKRLGKMKNKGKKKRKTKRHKEKRKRTQNSIKQRKRGKEEDYVRWRGLTPVVYPGFCGWGCTGSNGGGVVFYIGEIKNVASFQTHWRSRSTIEKAHFLTVLTANGSATRLKSEFTEIEIGIKTFLKFY